VANVRNVLLVTSQSSNESPTQTHGKLNGLTFPHVTYRSM
jgi:hypothetical protein